jgi:hypothetical protein
VLLDLQLNPLPCHRIMAVSSKRVCALGPAKNVDQGDESRLRERRTRSGQQLNREYREPLYCTLLPLSLCSDGAFAARLEVSGIDSGRLCNY